MMNQIINNRCILVLQRDVFVQFQSIKLATKLDTNAQMEMFFQLYHCVKTAHIKSEEVDISSTTEAKKKAFSNSPKKDSINHEKLATTEENFNQTLQCLTEYGSSNNKEETSSVSDKTDTLSSEYDAENMEIKNLSVSFSLSNQDQPDSEQKQMVNNVNLQIPDGIEMDDSSVNLSADNTEYSGSNAHISVPNTQLEVSQLTSGSTPVRKGRRKSAPKRAAPVDNDEDALDMQLLLKQECLDDHCCLSADAVHAAGDEDHMNTPSDSKMMLSGSYLPQTIQYTNDAKFELPTMVCGTNYSPMTSTPSKQHSECSYNNQDTTKTSHRNSISANVLKKHGHLRTIAMGLKRNLGISPISGIHDSSNCESEMDSTERHSDSGDISDDYGYGGTILKCEYCNFTSHRRYNLNRHRRIHTGNMFKCESCGRKFNEPGKLKSHSCKLPVTKSPKPSFSCNICSTSGLKSVEALRQHFQLEHDIYETYVCVSCNPQVIFHSPHEFKTHLEILHTVGRSISKSLCDECGREFKYLRSLQKHKLTCLITMYKLKSVKVENIPSTNQPA